MLSASIHRSVNLPGIILKLSAAAVHSGIEASFRAYAGGFNGLHMTFDEPGIANKILEDAGINDASYFKLMDHPCGARSVFINNVGYSVDGTDAGKIIHAALLEAMNNYSHAPAAAHSAG